MKAAILTDLTKCIGCKACVYACKEINKLPQKDCDVLSENNWTIVYKRKGLYIRKHCRHCLEPACVSACPVAALQKTESGAVIYKEERCIGCRYCMLACPFHIPKYEWDKALPKIQKCIFCYEKRLSVGKQPACTSACPTDATIFGDRDELIKEAQTRINKYPDRYIKHIYGLKEAGGTSLLYLSSIPFFELGFEKKVLMEAYPILTWKVLSKLSSLVGIETIFLFGVWWIINRRMKLQGLSKDELEKLDSELKEEEEAERKERQEKIVR